MKPHSTHPPDFMEVTHPSHHSISTVPLHGPRPASARPTYSGPKGNEQPTAVHVLNTVVELNACLAPDSAEEDIVREYLAAMQTLWPGARFVCRVYGATLTRASLVLSTHPLRPGIDPVLTLSEAALSHLQLDAAVLRAQGAVVVDMPPRLSQGACDGFDVALVCGDAVLGSLALEFAHPHQLDEDSRRLVHHFAKELAATIRNTRTLHEAHYLRDYLSKLLEHANAPILVIGAQRDIRVCNRAFLAMVGGDHARYKGRDFLEIVPHHARARALELLTRASEGHEGSDVEIELVGENRQGVHLALNVAPVLAVDGSVDSMIAVGRDLTELRHLQEQMVQAEKLATLGQLAAGVVHEINNPLTSITIYSEHLLRKAERSNVCHEDVEKLSRIVEGAERIRRFTRDLVTYARPSTEALKEVLLHQILDQSVLFCEHVIASRGVTVRKAYGQNIPAVLGVHDQLQQVFINLITNACHAMTQDEGELIVATVANGNRTISVHIQDNGDGIEAAVLEHIFEPFFSTKGEGQGTGLGLSIVRNIILHHQGHIDVQSRVLGGTTFSITLPCLEGPV
ncbi:MAG: two-component system sensor histidine kinase NtrB [Polyangiales bacterium]